MLLFVLLWVNAIFLILNLIIFSEFHTTLSAIAAVASGVACAIILWVMMWT